MFLSNGLVDRFDIGGDVYAIQTSARFWIAISLLLEEAHASEKVGIYFSSVILKKGQELPKDPLKIETLLSMISGFYNCDYDKINDFKPVQNPYKKAFDYDVDAGRIYSAFYQTYGIDIEDKLDTMHWWKFRALFDNLSSETRLVSYFMHYRNYDRKQFEYTNDKKGVLKSKIDEAINIVSFSNDFDVIQETPFEKKTRLAREQRESENGR